MNVNPLGTKTTIINLTLASENPQRGSDILNSLITEYRNQNIEEKNIVATNTVNFITNRLAIVKNESR